MKSRTAFVAILLVGAGCRPRRAPEVSDAAPAPSTISSVDAVITPVPTLPVPPPPRKLRLVKGSTQCKVVDDVTGVVVGRATTADTAAGGTEVECLDFGLDGKVIYFGNSRGKYVKDARLGGTNDQALPCGDGVIADDLRSCIDLDYSPFVLKMKDDDEDLPIALKLCPIPSRRDGRCTPLTTIKRGGNRLVSNKPPTPRTWDAAYCDSSLVVVLANDKLRLMTVPQGKLVASANATKLTRVTCKDGTATASGGSYRKTFRITSDGLEDEAPDGGS